MAPLVLFNSNDFSGGVSDLAPTIDNSGAACSYFRSDGSSALSAADERELVLGGILDHLQNSGLDCSNLVHQSILEGVASQSPDFLFVGDALDADYASLLTSIRAGWVDEFRIANASWASNDVAGANITIASINPVCPQDAYRQYGLQRYWNRFDESVNIANLRPSFPFSVSEYAQLENIASLDVQVGGYGTIQARALTDWMPSSDSHAAGLLKDQPTGYMGEINIRLYPNPTASSLTIDGLTPNLQSWQVFDAAGKSQLVPGTLIGERLTLQITGLNPGVYALVLHLDGQLAVSKHTFIKMQ